MINELTILKKDVDNFLLTNKEKYNVFCNLQDSLVKIDEYSFHQIIDYVEKHKNIFFNGYSVTLLFFRNIILLARSNFKKLEQILDVCIHFSKNIKAIVTEEELLSVSKNYIWCVNYLFYKNFFNIITIVQSTSKNIFINFFPEIEQYDPDYAKIRKDKILNSKSLKKHIRFNFLNILSDYQSHILNRNSNYEPSILHKSIREDNIDTFQSLISKNNIKLNDPIQISMYERSITKEKKLTLIKIAAIYNSVKIFKFLLMNDAKYDGDLLCYAYYGASIDIISLIELKDQTKLKRKYNPIEVISNINQNDLLDHFLENSEDEIIENNDEVKKVLVNFKDDDDNQYNSFNYNFLIGFVFNYNIQIILKCLPKISFIVKNYELIERSEEDMDNSCNIITVSSIDFDLFKFLLTQIKPEVQIENCYFLFALLRQCVSYQANDSFKFLYPKLKDHLLKFFDVYYFLTISIKSNIEIADYLLESFFDDLKNNVDYNTVEYAIEYYNENFVVKLIKMYNPSHLIDETEYVSQFIQKLIENFSDRMIISLFEKLCKLLSRSNLVIIADFCKDIGKISIYNLINENLP